MGWKNRASRDTTRYSVSLSTTSSSSSALLGHKTGSAMLSSAVQKVAAAFAIVMLLVVGFSGTIATSQPAEANMFQDAIDGVCAGEGSSGYGAVDRNILSPNTLPEGKNRFANATPYEKYGMSGTEWTTWVGFTPKPGKISDKDHAGSGTSAGIISLIGGNSKESNLTQWEAQTKDKERDYPGLFNVSNECAYFSVNSVPTQLGNLLMGTGKIVTWLAGYAYQTSAESSSNIYAQMEKPVESIVTAMKDKLYFAYLMPMIMIGALWMAYIGLFRRQATTAFSGLVWSIAAIVASVAFMTKPMLVPEVANSVVSGISQGGMASITSYTNNDKANMCNANRHDAKEDASRTTIRSVQCNMWYAFVYTPWAIGQFGANPSDLTAYEKNHPNGMVNRASVDGGLYAYRGNGLDLRVLTQGAVTDDDVSTNGLKIQKVTLGNKEAPASEQNWALYLLDHRSNWDNATEPQKLNKARAQLAVTANQLSDADYNADFRGNNGEMRIGMGLLALGASLGGGIMITFISVSLIVLDIGIIILALISPLFFLAALHPGAGRQIAMGWVEMIVKMSLKRIALSIFLAIMIAIFGIIIQSSKDMEWAVAMILIVAIAVGGMTYQRQISEMFNSFSLGGRQFQQQAIPGSYAAKRFVRNKTREAGNFAKRSMRTAGENAKDNFGNMTKRGATGAGVAGGAGAAPDSSMSTAQAERDEAMRRTLEQRGLLPSGAGEAPEDGSQGPEGFGPDGTPNHPGPDGDGGAGAAPESIEGRTVESDGDTENTETHVLDNSGAGAMPLESVDYDNEDTESDNNSGAQAIEVENPDFERNHELDSPEFDNAETVSRVDAGGMGAAPVLAAGGVAAAVAEHQAERKQKRQLRADERNERAIERERRNLTNAAYSKDGTIRVATREDAIASLDAKKAEAQAKRDHRMRHINKVKSGTLQGAQAASLATNRVADVSRQAFVEPAQELKSMVKGFREDSLNPAIAKAQALPAVQSHMAKKRETKEFNELYKKNLADVRNEARQPALEAKAQQEAFKKDMKNFTGNREARRVYAATKYGLTPSGEPLNQQGSGQRQTLTPPAPMVQNAPQSSQQNKQGTPVQPPAPSAPTLQPGSQNKAPSAPAPGQSAPQLSQQNNQRSTSAPVPAPQINQSAQRGNANPAPSAPALQSGNPSKVDAVAPAPRGDTKPANPIAPAPHKAAPQLDQQISQRSAPAPAPRNQDKVVAPAPQLDQQRAQTPAPVTAPANPVAEVPSAPSNQAREVAPAPAQAVAPAPVPAPVPAPAPAPAQSNEARQVAPAPAPVISQDRAVAPTPAQHKTVASAPAPAVAPSNQAKVVETPKPAPAQANPVAHAPAPTPKPAPAPSASPRAVDSPKPAPAPAQSNQTKQVDSTPAPRSAPVPAPSQARPVEAPKPAPAPREQPRPVTPAPAPSQAKPAEAPKSAPAPREQPKPVTPAPAPSQARPVEAPKPAPAPAPTPRPAPAPSQAKPVEAPKPSPALREQPKPMAPDPKRESAPVAPRQQDRVIAPSPAPRAQSNPVTPFPSPRSQEKAVAPAPKPIPQQAPTPRSDANPKSAPTPKSQDKPESLLKSLFGPRNASAESLPKPATPAPRDTPNQLDSSGNMEPRSE